MKLFFTGEVGNLLDGVELLKGDLSIDIYQLEDYQTNEDSDNECIEITISLGEGVHVAYRRGKGYIVYREKIHFFRALGLFVETIRDNKDKGYNGDFVIDEDIYFEKNGVMFDVSRNAVLKPDTIKYFLRKMALMGLNLGMMYTEDTYEVKEWPYFGYMRGRYSYGELKDIDDYAYLLGVELIPCIQTLGHLTNVLRWDKMAELKDTNSVLLVGNEKVYQFIEDMIASASKPYRSNRIHIGMDEAMDLGLGRYLQQNGFRHGFDLMTEHLDRVMEIIEKHNLEPMMWSDMYFRLASKTKDYYDLDGLVPEDVMSAVPKNMGLIYWDYYHHEEDFYVEYIKRHKAFNNKIIFAGGVWTWTSPAVNYGKTFTATMPALAACKKEGIKEVFCTAWGDNGGETNLLASLLGLQLYAEHGYSDELDMDKLKKRFRFCTGMDANAFLDISLLDETPGTAPGNISTANPSKYLLYQDPLLGLFDGDIGDHDLRGHYAVLKLKYQSYAQEDSAFKLLFDFYCKLASTLEVKSELGLDIIKAYKTDNKEELTNIIDKVIPEALSRYDVLRNTWRDLWFSTNKPFGFEVVDIRVGGVEARLKSTQRRLQDYVNGDCEIIEELEQERLPVVKTNRWSLIATACPI